MSVVRPIARPLSTPIASPMRGGSLPWEDGGGGALWTPARASGALLWWDPSVLAAGAVASWTDRIAGVAATQGTGAARPTQSATAFNSAYPGVSFDGGDLLAAAGAGAVLNGKTALAFTLAAVDADTALNRPLLEYGPTGGNVAGGFSIMINLNGGGTFGAFVTATTLSQRDLSDTLGTAAVWTIIIDGTNPSPIRAIRKNSAAQALTGTGTITPNWSAGNNTLAFGNRAAGTLPWTGTMGHVVIRNSVATDTDLERIERYVGARAGITW